MYEVLFWVAVSSTIATVVSVVMSLIGIDGHSDISIESDVGQDGDGDVGDSFPIFTFKNLVGFLAMFSWVGLVCNNYSLGLFLTILYSSVAGIMFILILTGLFVVIHKLGHDNVLILDEAVGKTATVYVGITKETPGQVSLILNGSLQYIKASTKETSFEYGDSVKVIESTESGLIVEAV